MINLSPLKRRLVYVAIFETLAVIFTTFVLMALSSSTASHSFVLAVFISTIAVIWNFAFNTGFEALEKYWQVQERSVKVRIFHACGFELGLFLFCLPLYMYWYQVSWLAALYMETSLLISFLIFTYVFTWVFDQFFTLPQHLPVTEDSSLPL